MSIERLRKAVAPQSDGPEPLRADGAAPFISSRDKNEPFLGIMPAAFVAAGGLMALTLLVFILGTA